MYIYELTSNLPKSETYSFISQLRRAAVSIPANIVEAFKKRTARDKVKFLNIAQGSLEEYRYYLILVQDLNYGNTKELSLALAEVGKLLNSYDLKIRKNHNLL